MTDRRLKNRQWSPGDDGGHAPTWERVNTAILLDIRDELQQLNRLLGCGNFTQIPMVLRDIRARTSTLANEVTRKRRAAKTKAGAR